MVRPAGFFDDFFRNQTYGLRGDYVARQWHVEAVEAYIDSVMTFGDEPIVTQHQFCLNAGTGSGKTQAAAHVASFMLNRKLADQIIFICPNRSIRRKAQKVFRDVFGIDLATFHAKRHKDGIPRTKQGYILTYAHLIQDPVLHRRICGADSLVIFDEIHHLGDEGGGWGKAATEAFGRCRFILALSGTPYRADNTPIPFVTYEESPKGDLLRFKADPPIGFTYPLGRAVADGICRKPLFEFHDASVKIRPIGSEEITVTFKNTDVNTGISRLRLLGAVKYSSAGRTEMLKAFLDRCRDEGRKGIIFLGGDTQGDHTPTTDATEFMPTELRELGLTDAEFEVVTGESDDAQEKIENFGASEKWILVSINMVSEGTDIPELSAALFLTSVTAKQTTTQRIGRILRSLGENDPFRDALVFMFEDPDLVELAAEFEAEISHEIDLSRAKRLNANGNGGEGQDDRERAETYCFDGGRPTFVMFGGHRYPAAIIEAARRRCKQLGLPATMLQAVINNIMMRDADAAG